MDEGVLLPLAMRGPRTTPAPRRDPMASLVEQERVIQTLQRQVAAQNYLLERARQEKESITAELARREAAEQALRVEREALAQLEQALRAELLGLKASDSWRLVRLLRRWRIAVAPPASRRERLFFLAKRAIKFWQRRGLTALVVKAAGKIGAKGLHAWRCMLERFAVAWRTLCRPALLSRPAGSGEPAYALSATRLQTALGAGGQNGVGQAGKPDLQGLDPPELTSVPARSCANSGLPAASAVATSVHPSEQDSGENTRFGSDDDPLAVAQRMADPGLPFRRQIDLARLVAPGPGMLYVTHSRGGGTERHVRDMATRLEQEGVRVIVLRPLGEGSIRLERLGEATLPNLVFALPGEYWTLRAALQALGVHHVHIHHTIDLPAAVLDLIADLGLAYDCTIHDYYTVCPRVNLLDDAGVYCGEPGPARCNVCLEKTPHLAGEDVEILKWRARHRTLVAGARKVFVPHEDVAVRLARYFPEVEFTVRPHFEIRSESRSVAAGLSPGDPLRVAVIGHLCLHKGAAIVVDCACDALARRLPIHFVVVGYTDRDELLRGLPNVSITGPYRDDEILELLKSLRCHCAFFPSVCPETFSYTLSIAFRGGLFPVAFDLGAPAGRIRAAGTGHLLPLTTKAATINQELLSLAPRLTEAPAGAAAESGRYANLLADYYGLAERLSAAA